MLHMILRLNMNTCIYKFFLCENKIGSTLFFSFFLFYLLRVPDCLRVLKAVILTVHLLTASASFYFSMLLG